jgi:hypothetical protein
MNASKFACPDSIKLGQGYRAALFAITENGKLLRIHIYPRKDQDGRKADLGGHVRI